jgi:hypothetical protein
MKLAREGGQWGLVSYTTLSYVQYKGTYKFQFTSFYPLYPFKLSILQPKVCFTKLLSTLTDYAPDTNPQALCTHIS